MRQCLKAWVYGKVQGVGYRIFCTIKARELGVSGYALNLPDGRVELLMCGEQAAIQKMIEALYEGPVFSRVLGVDVEQVELQDVTAFTTG